jgi:predicted nucleic acid-binding protein
VIVVDASVIAPALIDEDALGDRLRARLKDERLAAPAFIDLEVASIWRRYSRAGWLSARRADAALDDLDDLPLERALHGPLMRRIWDLRDNVSAYDAPYVALAESLDTILLTGDERLARAPGIQCEVELVLRLTHRS